MIFTISIPKYSTYIFTGRW
ncbi:hypothetical protein RDI58_026329 [Solanum bulbocastanum]|uniref:Uncharacterized protein n=1 Tax=Solanum bulbocastanum TaxID=147425 RepID=A0AAN8SZZ1_SOLBU